MIEAETARLRKASRRYLLAAKATWVFTFFGNAFVLWQNVCHGGTTAFLAGVNGFWLAVSIGGIAWTFFLWPKEPKVAPKQ